MDLFTSWDIIQEIAEDIEEFYEIESKEALKLAIEFWKAQSLHKIRESLSKDGTLINKLDSIDNSIIYK